MAFAFTRPTSVEVINHHALDPISEEDEESSEQSASDGPGSIKRLSAESEQLHTEGSASTNANRLSSASGEQWRVLEDAFREDSEGESMEQEAGMRDGDDGEGAEKGKDEPDEQRYDSAMQALVSSTRHIVGMDRAQMNEIHAAASRERDAGADGTGEGNTASTSPDENDATGSTPTSETSKSSDSLQLGHEAHDGCICLPRPTPTTSTSRSQNISGLARPPPALTGPRIGSVVELVRPNTAAQQESSARQARPWSSPYPRPSPITNLQELLDRDSPLDVLTLVGGPTEPESNPESSRHLTRSSRYYDGPGDARGSIYAHANANIEALSRRPDLTARRHHTRAHDAPCNTPEHNTPAPSLRDPVTSPPNPTARASPLPRKTSKKRTYLNILLLSLGWLTCFLVLLVAYGWLVKRDMQHARLRGAGGDSLKEGQAKHARIAEWRTFETKEMYLLRLTWPKEIVEMEINPPHVSNATAPQYRNTTSPLYLNTTTTISSIIDQIARNATFSPSPNPNPLPPPPKLTPWTLTASALTHPSTTLLDIDIPITAQHRIDLHALCPFPAPPLQTPPPRPPSVYNESRATALVRNLLVLCVAAPLVLAAWWLMGWVRRRKVGAWGGKRRVAVGIGAGVLVGVGGAAGAVGVEGGVRRVVGGWYG